MAPLLKKTAGTRPAERSAERPAGASAPGGSSMPGAPAFITLEGIDGCGKSTQARLLAAALSRAGYDVCSVREPGGTALSEKIRALLLDPENAAMGDTCELLLYEAARAQLVHEVIAPALAAGRVVVCDRFYDSTTAYQGFADGLDRRAVARANALAVDGRHPTLTLVYDIDPEAAFARRADRAGGADRMEAKGRAYQEKVAAGFRAVASEDPARVKLIPATGDVAHVFVRTVGAVKAAGLSVPDAAAEAAYLELCGA